MKEREFSISYKQGGNDLNTEKIATNREEALSKFYDDFDDLSDIWDVVCW